MTPITHYPFQFYCKQIITIFKKAKKTTNPALYLYKNKAREIIFKAESILRITNKLFEDDQINAWHLIIKKLEDHLGVIDDHIVMLANFSKIEAIKIQQLGYISRKLDDSVEDLNQKLYKYDFYFKELLDMNSSFKINFNDKAIVIKIHEEIKNELIEARDYFNQYPKIFTDIETQVHELRRKLRWVSIYAGSFKGVVVLHDVKKKYVWEKEFITKTEIANPFNKLTVKKNLNQYISFNKKAFYALSFVINNIGIIKDKGLALIYLEKSIQKTHTKRGANPAILAREQLNVKYTKTTLLKEAHALFDDYFKKYKIHELLT